jgi:hypothetical protein
MRSLRPELVRHLNRSRKREGTISSLAQKVTVSCQGTEGGEAVEPPVSPSAQAAEAFTVPVRGILQLLASRLGETHKKRSYRIKVAQVKSSKNTKNLPGGHAHIPNIADIYNLSLKCEAPPSSSGAESCASV